MSKIEHKYDIGQIVLIPMVVDSVGVEHHPAGSDSVKYGLKPINWDAVISSDEGQRVMNILDEKYIYSEYNGEVIVKKAKPSSFTSGIFGDDWPLGLKI